MKKSLSLQCTKYLTTKSRIMKKIIFKTRENVHVLRYGKTSNAKIAMPDEKIVQTYHFSLAQYNFVLSGGKGISLESGFLNPEYTKSNCGQCPLRKGGCYTFKFNQALGHLSMLRSMTNKFENVENLPEFHEIDFDLLGEWVTNKYVRFGTYGNPDTMPIDLVEFMCERAKTWTGYTHNWKDESKIEYLQYFMGSAHNDKQLSSWEAIRTDKMRFFITDGEKGIQCPASEEYEARTGKTTTCSKCGLCSGTMGKGKGDVRINTH